MKKILTAVICIAMATMGCMAKNEHNNGHKNHGQEHKMEMRHQPGRMNHRADHVIDMKVIKEMGLSDKQMKKIETLNDCRCEEMKTLAFDKGSGHKPQMAMVKVNPEKMRAHREKMQQVNAKYRKELKQIMGSKTYTAYLEKVNDRLAMHQPQHRGMKKDPQVKPHTKKKPAVVAPGRARKTEFVKNK